MSTGTFLYWIKNGSASGNLTKEKKRKEKIFTYLKTIQICIKGVILTLNICVYSHSKFSIWSFTDIHNIVNVNRNPISSWKKKFDILCIDQCDSLLVSFLSYSPKVFSCCKKTYFQFLFKINFLKKSSLKWISKLLQPLYDNKTTNLKTIYWNIFHWHW